MMLRNLLASALLSFIIANLIHNNGGLDPAIIPAAALANPAATKPFLNHLALLTAALLAIASAVAGLMPGRRARA